MQIFRRRGLMKGAVMLTLKTRLSAIEQRLTPAGVCPDLIILHGDEAISPHQISELERAAKFNLPTLTITIGSARHDK
jgi:hypothetical protein